MLKLLSCDVRSRNGSIYPKNVIEKMMTYYKKPLTDVKNIQHEIIAYEFRGNELWVSLGLYGVS